MFVKGHKMAAVDKIFGTIEEYDEFHHWCEHNIPLALQYFTPRNYFIEKKHSICLLPENIDMVLLDHCPLEFITEQIREQYDLE